MHLLKKFSYENILLKLSGGLILLLIDAVTKFFVASGLPLMFGKDYPYRGIPVFKNFLGIEFSLVHATNKGAAWGLFSDFQGLLLISRMLLIISLIAYLIFYNRSKSTEMPLILVGFAAFGNILDYFLYGHVIDMFHFVLWGYSFPVFNVADTAICLSILWLFLLSFEKEEIA